jgi:hypothetical protein
MLRKCSKPIRAETGVRGTAKGQWSGDCPRGRETEGEGGADDEEVDEYATRGFCELDGAPIPNTSPETSPTSDEDEVATEGEEAEW